MIDVTFYELSPEPRYDPSMPRFFADNADALIRTVRQSYGTKSDVRFVMDGNTWKVYVDDVHKYTIIEHTGKKLEGVEHL